MPTVIRFQSSYVEPYPLQVQGESFYKINIEKLFGFIDDDEGVNADDFIARLILDDNNMHDAGNAVRVEIDGKQVGNLSKPSAKAYRKRLAELGLSNVIGECYASIKGGFIKKSTGEQADFGVRLDLDLESFKVLEPKPVERAPAAEPGPLMVDTQPGAGTSGPMPTASVPPARKSQSTKIPFIPMKGRGWLYYLFIFPFVAVINLFVLFFAGIWLGAKWLAENVTRKKN